MSVKISELPILSSLADNDIVAGVDVSGNITSKIEMATLKNYIDTNTQYTAGTNIDITNNVISAPDVYNKDEMDNQIEELQSEVDSLSTIFNAFPTESGEGESVTLDDTAEVKFKKFDLKGNTSQTGTPTPSSPIPVNVVSGDNEIVVSGKNLFKPYEHTDNNTGLTLEIVNGNVHLYGTATSNNSFRIMNNVILNGTYTWSLEGNINLWAWNSTTSSADVQLSQNANKVTKTYNGNNSILMAFTPTTGTTYDITFKPMLEKGSTNTTYEPYIGNTYNIDLPEGMELCKIGNYQDYFYKDSGKWYLHKEIGKVVLNGSESWDLAGSYQDIYQMQISKSDVMYVNDTITRVLSNYFEGTWWNSSWTRNSSIVLGNGLIRVMTSDYTTTDAFKTWLTTHNLITYYVLKTPTNTEITYQPLIDQLNLLEKL